MVSAARQRFVGRRIVVCFQPHTYSRSSYLLEEFRSCFEGIDRLFILATYAAREDAGAGLDAEGLAKEVASPPAEYVANHDEGVERITGQLKPGDVFFTVGAGDVTEVGPRVLERLRAAGGSR